MHSADARSKLARLTLVRRAASRLIRAVDGSARGSVPSTARGSAPGIVRAVSWLGVALAIGSFMGCAPQIGDKCSVSTDCSVNGDRLCDTTQPDGYCTVFACQPDMCPGDSVCVAFRDSSCGDVTGRAVRFQRTFCMKSCTGDGDCRAGYACIDLGSQVVDTVPSNRAVCTVPLSMEPPPPPADAGAGGAEAGASATTAPICSPFDGSFEQQDGASADGAGVDSAEEAAPSADGAVVDSAEDAAADALEAGGEEPAEEAATESSVLEDGEAGGGTEGADAPSGDGPGPSPGDAGGLGAAE